ncbi:ligand-binding sensor domain-containing diguanylate cyclase [Bryocella elongata]|uniref:ligand-binding sensor domain-containing diguanylate cyclase n=1 Tax=Bryocella elongata TaxID=863522 RepID=UPI0013595910|nr:ligand-binding sensor domain-containing diguanylate cyclase [Bryocella elongata]
MVLLARPLVVLEGQEYSFRHYDASDGLNDLGVHCIVQVTAGPLYTCTDGGLYRYAGSRVHRVPLTVPGDSYVAGGTEGRSGEAWFATIHSLYLLDAGGMHAVTSPPEGFEFDLFASLAASRTRDGRIYFVSRHQLYLAERASTGQWTVQELFGDTLRAQHPGLNNVSFVYAAPDDTLWLGCDSQVCRYDGRSLKLYGTPQGLPAESWRSALLDSRGRLWVRSEHSIYRLDRDAERFHSLSGALTGESLTVRGMDVAEDPQGRVLINLSKGLARFEQDRWRVFDRSSGIPPNEIDALSFDHQGSLWLGLSGHGLARWRGYDSFENWTSATGLSSDVVWNFLRDRRERMWVATEGGLDEFRPGAHAPSPATSTTGRAMRRVQTLAETPDGHIWAGSDDGSVVDFDPDTHRTRPVAQLSGIFQLLFSHSGRMWICSIPGLYVVDWNSPQRKPQRVAAVPSLQGHLYEGVEDAHGGLWFIGEKGLSHFVDGHWSQIRLPAGFQPVLSSQITLGKDGSLWLSGAKPSLAHLRVVGDHAELIESAPWATSEDLSVYLIASDHRGWIWVGTGQGIWVSDGKRWIHVTVDDGLVWNDINSSGFYDDHDGSVWIGTSGGAARLPNPETLFSAPPLTAAIDTARWGDHVLDLRIDNEIPFRHQALTAHMMHFDFRREATIHFRYRMVGLEEDWQDSTEPDIRYPPMPPGSYLLEIKAMDEGDGRTSQPVVLRFHVLPPWWQTRSVYLLELLSALLLGLSVWRWSVRMLVRRQRLLEDLVAKRTAELQRETQELVKARNELQVLAMHDSLTGLLNRGAIIAKLEEELQRSTRDESPLALVLLDIDHFKRINDTWGHTTGDAVLKEYARRMRELARSYDAAGRYGGEEMLVLLPGLRETDSNERLRELHTALCQPIEVGILTLTVTCSIGVTWRNGASDSAHSLLERADKALYRAKNEGRNRMAFAALTGSLPEAVPAQLGSYETPAPQDSPSLQ